MIEDNKTDKELVKRIKKGDQRAFKLLFYNYEKRVYYFVLKIVGEKEPAEEILQDVFVKIWNYRLKLDETKSISAFLFKTSKNTALNYLRDCILLKEHQNIVADNTDVFANELLPDDHLVVEDYMRSYNNIIDQLPSQRCEIFKMSRQEGLSYQEIAEKLKISKNTVRLQIVESLKFIRRNIQSECEISFIFILSLLMMF